MRNLSDLVWLIAVDWRQLSISHPTMHLCVHAIGQKLDLPQKAFPWLISVRELVIFPGLLMFCGIRLSVN